LCAAISVHAPWTAYLRTGHLPTLTWLVPVIILFPLLVPEPPRTMLWVSSLGAVMAPIGLLLLGARGAIEVRPADFWGGTLTVAVAVGIAAMASRAVYGARRADVALRTVGSYELLERLGKGGMGEVWKARHLFLARPAAVKLILADRLQGPREEREVAIERFTREARVTASLRSPHTVELFDFGASTDGSLYYAMELLDGMNAEHFVYRFGPLEPRRVVSWLVQVCHSLGEAHERQLVHRDIKPANLFVCRYGRDVDFVKVLDFGLTKPVETPLEPSLTAPGFRMGTPSYMAPEQIFGLEAEPRTDLYALGCVGYWLIAGVKPFEAESPAELLRQHAQTPAPPLSSKAPGPVPRRLEALIMSCLAKDPADRPADADRLGLALEESLESECWTAADAREWWERNP
jgi:serine/threonine-protein kinase